MYSDHPCDLNFPLLYFDANKEFAWTLEDAVRGTQIFGGIGSGKTSGSGKTIARSFLSSGYGGLVLCAKKEEREIWVQYVKETGRLDDLIVFSERNEFRFNFLDYEMTRDDRGGGHTFNIVKLFMTVHEMSSRSGGGQKASDPFWENALARLLSRLVELIKLSNQPLTIDNMYHVIASAPQDLNAFNHDDWIDKSLCVLCLSEAADNADKTDSFRLVDTYWTHEFPSLDEKTRSIIMESAFALFEPFMAGLMKELLSTKTNVTPEVTQHGKIILLDLPVKTHAELAIFAQSIWKYVWQQSIERRPIQKRMLPNFLWIDEAQYFLNQHDMLFQTTARSSRTCTVLLSQNISNYYAVMPGGQRFREMTSSLLGNLNTKIFHAQQDHTTNQFAADVIAQTFRLVSNYSNQLGNQGGSAGAGEQLIYQVLPVEFTLLRNGGTLNHLKVDAIITIAGRPLAGGKNHMKVTFNQQR